MARLFIIWPRHTNATISTAPLDACEYGTREQRGGKVREARTWNPMQRSQRSQDCGAPGHESARASIQPPSAELRCRCWRLNTAVVTQCLPASHLGDGKSIASDGIDIDRE